MAITGHYPFFHAFSEFLKDLFHASLSSSPVPLERQVQYFLLETPLPPLGKVEVRLQLSNQTMLVSRPPLNRLPMVDFSYRPLFASLSTDIAILVTGQSTDHLSAKLFHFGEASRDMGAELLRIERTQDLGEVGVEKIW